MDTTAKIKHYATLVIALLQDQQWLSKNPDDYQRMVVVDQVQNHYQLLGIGWLTPSHFVDNILLHIHIKPDGKIWLLENNTEIRVAEELVLRGVPKTDIVLGFHPPQFRALTGYAVA
jgi:hypothetical protein